LTATIVFVFAAPALALAQAAEPLQPLIDATADGGLLRLPPGVYAGPAVISRPMVLDGAGAVVVTGNKAGTVLTLNGQKITVQGLRLKDSGTRHENFDACLRIANASFSIIKDNVLENCLVAVDLHEANNNVLRRNQIRGGEPNLAIRGDALRAWRSNNNRVEHNVVVDHRDGLLFKYSNDNVIVGNSVANGRYGTHFMYSSGNVAQGNSYSFNTVGLFSMYSHSLCVVGNRVVHGNGPAGIGIGVKEASAIDIENNEVLGNAIGLYMDDSPFDPDEVNTVKGNRFAFNGIAVQFHNNKEGNTFSRNIFVSNLTDVAARSGGATASLWRGNYWDNYEGFDRQGKGVGNTPYEIYAYADRIWADVPMTAFYRASPVFETIDFLERLAPFSSPRLVMRDDQPLLQTPSPDNAQCGVKQ